MLGTHRRAKKIKAPKNLAKSTWVSRTGAVSKVSIVPVLDSSAKRRIVSSDGSTRRVTQKKMLLKKLSTMEIPV